MCPHSGRALSCTGVAGLYGKTDRYGGHEPASEWCRIHVTMLPFQSFGTEWTQRQTCFSAELQGSTQQELNQSGLKKGCMELRLSAQACQCSPCWRIEPHSTALTHRSLPESALDLQPQSSQFHGTSYPETTPISRPGLQGPVSLPHPVLCHLSKCTQRSPSGSLRADSRRALHGVSGIAMQKAFSLATLCHFKDRGNCEGPRHPCQKPALGLAEEVVGEAPHK